VHRRDKCIEGTRTYLVSKEGRVSIPGVPESSNRYMISDVINDLCLDICKALLSVIAFKYF
jgi:hypothetical protein